MTKTKAEIWYVNSNKKDSAGREIFLFQSKESPKDLKELKFAYSKVHEMTVESNGVRETLEKIFADFNMSSSNPLSSDNNPGQTKIHSKGVRHTSMSVGDVIKLGSSYYIVRDEGFDKLSLR